VRLRLKTFCMDSSFESLPGALGAAALGGRSLGLLVRSCVCVCVRAHSGRCGVWQHRFIVGQEVAPASNNHLPHFRQNMKKFNARRKFKAGIMMVQAASLLERKSFSAHRPSASGGTLAAIQAGQVRGVDPPTDEVSLNRKSSGERSRAE
jgi:hypothetical protein